MFVNNHEHSIDDKGRMVLPADIRNVLEGGCYVVAQPGGCLAIFPRESFKEAAARIKERQRNGEISDLQFRAFFGSANEVVPDKQGRIPLTQSQRTYAKLDRNVMVVGVWEHIEIWDAARWASNNEIGEQELALSSL